MWGEAKIVFTQFTSQIGDREKNYIFAQGSTKVSRKQKKFLIEWDTTTTTTTTSAAAAKVYFTSTNTLYGEPLSHVLSNCSLLPLTGTLSPEQAQFL